tara:strand:+ start:752 stop:1036 length:285 start_codon:yes stop_codon:yes gene_type:complete
MKTITTAIFLACINPAMSFAEWCDPPIAPTPTTPELARDFREEFKDEFDRYFRDASAYAACLDAERQRIFLEMQNTTQRYERFLNDSAKWSPSQ